MNKLSNPARDVWAYLAQHYQEHRHGLMREQIYYKLNELYAAITLGNAIRELLKLGFLFVKRGTWPQVLVPVKPKLAMKSPGMEETYEDIRERYFASGYVDVIGPDPAAYLRVANPAALLMVEVEYPELLPAVGTVAEWVASSEPDSLRSNNSIREFLEDTLTHYQAQAKRLNMTLAGYIAEVGRHDSEQRHFDEENTSPRPQQRSPQKHPAKKGKLRIVHPTE